MVKFTNLTILKYDISDKEISGGIIADNRELERLVKISEMIHSSKEEDSIITNNRFTEDINNKRESEIKR